MKNKNFLFFPILILLLLFYIVSFVCSCGVNQIVNSTSPTIEETQVSQDLIQTTESEETINETEITETNDKKDEESTDSKSSDSQATTPTIKLEIYEGPTYSEADNVCYYRIIAGVTGNPSPEITFSKDDSKGTWGKYKVQVNLK